jgi:hypothetical protein
VVKYREDVSSHLIPSPSPFLFFFSSFPSHFFVALQDLDYTCLRPFESVLSGARVVVAEDEPTANQGKLRNIVTKQEGLLGVSSS